MKYGTYQGNAARARTQCILVGVFESGQLTETAKELDKASDGYLKKVLRRGDIKGKVGQLLVLHDVPKVSATRLMLVGLGNRKKLDSASYVKAAQKAIAGLKAIAATRSVCCLLEVEVPGRDLAWKTRRLVETLEAGVYSFTSMKGKPPKKDGNALEGVDFLVSDRSLIAPVTNAIAVSEALTRGINKAKDLGNLPGNICTPSYLANQARKLAANYASIAVKVLNESEIKKLGMGAFMSVSQGSDQPGKLIIITHKGGKAKDAPHLLVGKGITFDSGGISLKPGAGMHEMIWDMCGAASVFGTMLAVAEQKLPLNVIGVLAAAENMPSGDASRPGDIVKTMSGQTVEILNTDAEGRLVLCDALTYIERYKPATVVDVATLTGACIVALGSHATAMYTNDDGLAADLKKAGEDSLDRVWPMPLWEDYQRQIDSAFADIANIGGREAGSVTAACFLARFTKSYRWAHLDIAGTAFTGSGPAKGATGRPVNLLFEYLNNLAGVS